MAGPRVSAGVRPTVSAVVAVHNGREFLPATLASIFAQTRPPDEVVVVDDGSTDGSGDLVEAAFPMARLVRQPRQGVALARNRGIAEATGDIVAFSDADDLWLPWKLEWEMDWLARGPAGGKWGLVSCLACEAPARNADRVASALARRGPAAPQDPERVGFADLLLANTLSASGTVVPRSLALGLGGFDPATEGAEDLDLWLRIAAGHEVWCFRQPLIVYRLTPGSFGSSLPRRLEGLGRVLAKWPPTTDPLPDTMPRLARAYTRRALALTYLAHRLGREVPASVWAGYPLDKPSASRYGYGLRLAERHPRLFSLACRAFPSLKAAWRALTRAAGAHIWPPRG